jgi:hypothetical protein
MRQRGEGTHPTCYLRWTSRFVSFLPKRQIVAGSPTLHMQILAPSARRGAFGGLSWAYTLPSQLRPVLSESTGRITVAGR